MMSKCKIHTTNLQSYHHLISLPLVEKPALEHLEHPEFSKLLLQGYPLGSEHHRVPHTSPGVGVPGIQGLKLYSKGAELYTHKYD